MSGSRLLALFVVLVAALAVVLVVRWQVADHGGGMGATGPSGPSGPVLVLPDLTPLPDKHDSGPKVKRSARRRGSTDNASRGDGSSVPSQTPAAHRRRSPTRSRGPTARAPKRRPPQGASQPAQPSNPPPSQQPPSRPPPVVTVPLPGVCADDLAHVGDCP